MTTWDQSQILGILLREGSVKYNKIAEELYPDLVEYVPIFPKRIREAATLLHRLKYLRRTGRIRRNGEGEWELNPGYVPKYHGNTREAHRTRPRRTRRPIGWKGAPSS